MIRAALLSVLVASGAASAQQYTGGAHLMQHMARGVPQSQVGDWVVYKVHGGMEGRTSFWRAAIVGEEKDRFGRDAYWLELEAGQHEKLKAPLLQAKLLIAKSDGGAGQAITRMYVGWGAEKVQEISAESITSTLYGEGAKKREERQKTKPAGLDKVPKDRTSIRTLPEARLMTLAGTVSAVPTEMRYGSQVVKRIWLSREIPVLQLAKLELPSIEHAIEIRDFGRNAKPQIIVPVEGTPPVNLEQGWPELTLVPSQQPGGTP